MCGIVRFVLFSAVFDQLGSFALEGDKRRVCLKQARCNADEGGFDGFGGNLNGKHFNSAQPGMGKLSACCLQQCGFGVGADKLV